MHPPPLPPVGLHALPDVSAVVVVDLVGSPVDLRAGGERTTGSSTKSGGWFGTAIREKNVLLVSPPPPPEAHLQTDVELLVVNDNP